MDETNIGFYTLVGAVLVRLGIKLKDIHARNKVAREAAGRCEKHKVYREPDGLCICCHTEMYSYE